MTGFLKRALSNLWHNSNANHKLTNLLHLASDDYVQRHLHGSPRYAEAKRLTRHEYKVFSQNGEDGIIAEIFRRIGTTNRMFVEFGVENGLENNTAFLLQQGWQGAWIEGSSACVASIRQAFSGVIASRRLHVQQAFITAENIVSLFQAANVPAEFDILSIDIDGNDYHVWNALAIAYRPRLVVVEYNSAFPPPVEWVKAYKADSIWDGTVNFSASLKSYERLATKHGYVLVGCDFHGINAFFVREDCAQEHFHTPASAEEHYERARYFLRASAGHPATASVFQ
jgi:hypothetical protein